MSFSKKKKKIIDAFYDIKNGEIWTNNIYNLDICNTYCV